MNEHSLLPRPVSGQQFTPAAAPTTAPFAIRRPLGFFGRYEHCRHCGSVLELITALGRVWYSAKVCPRCDRLDELVAR